MRALLLPTSVLRCQQSLRLDLLSIGRLQMFRGVDNVWTLVLNTGSMGKGGMQKVSVKVEPGEVEYTVDALKIVAMKKDA